MQGLCHPETCCFDPFSRELFTLDDRMRHLRRQFAESE
jgi:hypothetical protein